MAMEVAAALAAEESSAALGSVSATGLEQSSGPSVEIPSVRTEEEEVRTLLLCVCMCVCQGCSIRFFGSKGSI
jgi:hypothetical protein